MDKTGNPQIDQANDDIEENNLLGSGPYLLASIRNLSKRVDSQGQIPDISALTSQVENLKNNVSDLQNQITKLAAKPAV